MPVQATVLRAMKLNEEMRKECERTTGLLAEEVGVAVVQQGGKRPIHTTNKHNKQRKLTYQYDVASYWQKRPAYEADAL